MPDVKPGKYEAVLLEMRKRWDYATDQWQEIRDEAKTDMRYVAGDPWDTKDRRQREDAGRPVLALDELGQYTNQLINDIRQHKRAIKVTPIGSGANDKTAEIRGDLFRQIEYRSNAQQAYTTMFSSTVNCGMGFCRVKSQFVLQPTQSGGDGSSFNQELLIEPILNPEMVTPDPDALRPDGSDMQYAWIAEYWNYSEYKRKYPKARVQDFDGTLAKGEPTTSPWMTADKIRLAEYWTIDTSSRTLLLFKGKRMNPDGSRGDLEVFEDEWEQYPQLATVTPDDERQVEHPTVRSYLTNGFEVLKTTTWPGKSIPIICCYGKVLFVDEGSGAKKQILSLVRLARDPYMLYCYYRTAEAEQVGMSTKFPYFIREGSLSEEQKLNIQKSLHEPIAFIEVRGSTDSMAGNTPPELPQRNPFEPAIQALELGAEGARRAIQAAMGISPLPTAAQRQTEKSGVALKQIHDAEQQGSFHFIDAYEGSVTRVGALLNEVSDVYYDTLRQVTIRDGKGEPKQLMLNADPDTWIGVGYDHDVTLSTGPSLDSERDAANDFADTLTQSIPAIAPVIGAQAAAKLLSLTVKLKNLGPIGDEIAELLAPPQPEGGLPPQIQQAIQQLQGENQQLKFEKAVDAAKQQATIDKAKIDADSAQQIAAAKNAVDLQKAWIAVSAQLLIAAGKVGAENARSLAEALDKKDAAALGAHLEALDHVVTVTEAAKDREHEAVMASLEHEHAMAEGVQAHQAALVQGQQDAALAPQPEAGA